MCVENNKVMEYFEENIVYYLYTTAVYYCLSNVHLRLINHEIILHYANFHLNNFYFCFLPFFVIGCVSYIIIICKKILNIIALLH